MNCRDELTLFQRKASLWKNLVSARKKLFSSPAKEAFLEAARRRPVVVVVAVRGQKLHTRSASVFRVFGVIMIFT